MSSFTIPKFRFFKFPPDGNAQIRLLDAAIPKDFFVHTESAIEKAVESSCALFDDSTVKVKRLSTLNALRKKQEIVPVPETQKKPWLRYSSNKKWARKFPPKTIVKFKPVVLTISTESLLKIKALSRGKAGA